MDKSADARLWHTMDDDVKTVADRMYALAREQRDQAHHASERAAKDSTKLLGTLHAGLAISCATWLQRIFERSDIGGFLSLARSLDIAIVCDMLGLLAVGAAALFDTRTPHYIQESSKITEVRVLRLLHPETKDPDGETDAILAARGESYEQRYNFWNTVSTWLGHLSLIFLAVAFGAVAVGVAVDLHHLSAPTWPP